MRIDNGPMLTLQAHSPATDLPGPVNMMLKDSYRFLQSEREESAYHNTEMGPLRLGSKVDGFERKGQAWFVATELQSDLVVEVGDMSFHLHKFPLLSRSGKLNRLVFESRDIENNHIQLEGMPGGPQTFELAAKFCYGVAVELTSGNVAALRCAAEYLEMTEDLEEGNLVAKTETFLSLVVLASWKDSIIVLQSCESLGSWALQLQIVRRCSESIAWKACTDPRGIRWSFNEHKAEAKNETTSPLWSGLQYSASKQIPSDWWLEDVSVLCLDSFLKVISAIKVKGMKSELIGSAVMHYAMKWLPALAEIKGHGSKNDMFVDTTKELHSATGSFIVLGTRKKLKDEELLGESTETQVKNRVLIESCVSVLPPQKSTVPCSFIFQLLRMAKMLDANEFIVADLEKRAGSQLDQAILNDLLIPCFRHTCETLYDVDLMQRILDHFIQQEIQSPMASPGSGSDKEKASPSGSSTKSNSQAPHSVRIRVAKLMDNYLAEVGRDQNLSLLKFQALAEALPENSRVTDDGLYKAIDTYLKAHPTLTEHERKKLCRSLDCQRLSLDACMHAAQNERLPLRVVVQVLFGEQIRLRNAVSNGSSLVKEHTGPYQTLLHHSHSENDIKAIRLDVERMKTKFSTLQNDYSSIQQQIEKLSKHQKPSSPATGWKKLMHVPHFHTPSFFHLHHHHHSKDHHRHDPVHRRENFHHPEGGHNFRLSKDHSLHDSQLEKELGDSSRGSEGPSTPTHVHRHEHRKHKNLLNTIRRWRNSIS